MIHSRIFDAYLAYRNQVSGDAHILKKAAEASPATLHSLLDFFEARFNPNAPESNLMAWAPAMKDSDLSLLAKSIHATVRTNAYCPGTETIAIKIRHTLNSPSSGAIEIFIDHPEFSGIFLKSRAVSRGGIRHSERPDFRNECMQLMRTQFLKNALIVPSGGKGAFFLKHPNPNAERKKEQIQTCYLHFINAILDLSDTLQEGKILQPPHVRVYDEPDFYNVVAADRGTAHFSDLANEVSKQRGYWLGDAFASGGSNGYNHKELAITSKGVWVSVRHHLANLMDRMPTSSLAQPLRVVGIGSMSGDVFGNGLLEERHMQLLAAFSREFIFIDPTPDPETSYEERCRLFHKPHASWKDYRAFSPGGGVFSRKERMLTLSQEAYSLLNLPPKPIDPDSLIRHILTLSVDLLWLGGVGTYVDALGEETYDPFHDSVRVQGKDIAARMVGEGANLGITQKGRIAIALRGGQINTDAIDNCAGVNCSDHEVNIKILLDMALQKGTLSLASRNQFLENATQEVFQQVLLDNAWQNLTISAFQKKGVHGIDPALYCIEELSAGYRTISEDISFGPIQAGMRKKSALGLVRPEIAVLMAYAKIHLKDVLEKEDLDETIAWDVSAYFPKSIREHFGPTIPHYLLYRPLKRTLMANTLVHLYGPTLLHELSLEYALPFKKILSYVLVFHALFKGKELEEKIKHRLAYPKETIPLLEGMQTLLKLSMKQVLLQKKTFSEVHHDLLSSTSPLELLKSWQDLQEALTVSVMD